MVEKGYIMLLNEKGETIEMTKNYQIPPDAFDYIIYAEGNVVKAKNGKSGRVEFEDTDAASVINQSLQVQISDNTQKKRVVLVGCFEITNTIKIPDYTILDLRQAYLKPADNANVDIIRNADTVNGNQQIEILGGIIDGNKANQSTSGIAGIKITRGSDIKIIGTEVKNCYGDGIWVFQEVYRVKIDKVYSYDNGRAGIFIDTDNLDIDTNDTITNSVVASNESHGVHISDVLNVEVKNVISRSNGQNGFYIEDSQHIIVADSIAYNNSGHGIVVLNSRTETGYNIAKGCISRNNGSYGILVRQSQFNTIEACHCIGNSSHGLYADNLGTTPYSLHNSVIGCKFINNGGYGLQTAGASDYWLIDGCFFSGNTSGAYSLAGTNNVVGDVLSV